MLAVLNPFHRALGPDLDKLAGPVHRHVGQLTGSKAYKGTMERIWHKQDGLTGAALAPGLQLAALLQTLFPETGHNIPFELEITAETDHNGETFLRWKRTFHFPNVRRRFDSDLHFDDKRKSLVDHFGSENIHMEADLSATVENGGLTLKSGAQRFVTGAVALPLPAVSVGLITVTVMPLTEELMKIAATASHQLLGDFFGYEGTFAEVKTN
jgi:hypothetical protein